VIYGYWRRMDPFPLPGAAPATVVAPAPGGPQLWTGAPGAIVLGYRVRHGPDTIDETVVARSVDGEHYETVFSIGQDRFDAQSTERPALVRFEGGWRMYVSLATPGAKHWWIGEGARRVGRAPPVGRPREIVTALCAS
jgi:hypothetical protein